ncbi:MAG: RidA family protein [Verrucomicrobia bacterium]|nr:RidA family protein [Verrucomicrobiota bacterium]MBV9276528.1 RidA family protein [Verrucomicrobiota bacterium]
MHKTVIVPEAPAPAGPYSHAVVANGFVFVAGQGPQIPDTGAMPDNFKEQVRQTLKNVQTILRGVGCEMKDVIKVNAYLTDPTRFTEYNEVYQEFFGEHPPARTTVQAGLIKILVEIDCVAVLP